MLVKNRPLTSHAHIPNVSGHLSNTPISCPSISSTTPAEKPATAPLHPNTLPVTHASFPTTSSPHALLPLIVTSLLQKPSSQSVTSPSSWHRSVHLSVRVGIVNKKPSLNTHQPRVRLTTRCKTSLALKAKRRVSRHLRS
ncbi:hypothetical protein E2C01_072651 [Portunus trituberculatus]|uniref:Uncharacterized protein n=1 Tax=Portunus trituberculatus TaxID=210409 RepID=A0A5B7I8E7_PORTR|nr:hypothetical protein [Portunus trituberculatus]